MLHRLEVLLLLTTPSSIEKDIDVGRNSLQVFGHLLQGLIRNRWSGTITATTEEWKKRIYLDQGRFCFATSTLIDDRLGEVLYRYDLLTIDQLAELAMKVTPTAKFGQVMRKHGIMSSSQLWHALQTQVISIIKSLFMNERISYLIQRDALPAGNFIIIDDCYDLVENFKVFNSIFVKFCSQINEKTFLMVSKKKSAKLPRSSFYGDMLTLIENNRKVREVVKASRLSAPYTMAALLELLTTNICSLNTDFVNKNLLTGEELVAIKTAADSYRVVLEKAAAAFARHGCEAELEEVRKFSLTLVHPELRTLVLDCDGEISLNALARIADHCAVDQSRVYFYTSKIWMLTRFLVQTAVDLLPAEEVKQIVTVYRGLVVR